MSDDRVVSLRRMLQQTVHHAQEALSSDENNEDPRHVVDDLRKAQRLIDRVLKIYTAVASGAAGKPYK